MNAYILNNLFIDKFNQYNKHFQYSICTSKKIKINTHKNLGK